jgi:hypothetical protein
MVKVNYLEHPDDPAFALFNERYREFLAQYEATIVPLASEVDF